MSSDDNFERLLRAARELELALHSSNPATKKRSALQLQAADANRHGHSWEIRFQNDSINPVKTIAVASKPWFPLRSSQQNVSAPRPTSPTKQSSAARDKRLPIKASSSACQQLTKHQQHSADKRLEAMERVLRAQEESIIANSSISCTTNAIHQDSKHQFIALVRRWRLKVFELMLIQSTERDTMDQDRKKYGKEIEEYQRRLTATELELNMTAEKARWLQLESDHYKSIAESLENVNKELIAYAQETKRAVDERTSAYDELMNRLKAYEANATQRQFEFFTLLQKRIQRYDQLLNGMNDRISIVQQLLTTAQSQGADVHDVLCQMLADREILIQRLRGKQLDSKSGLRGDGGSMKISEIDDLRAKLDSLLIAQQNPRNGMMVLPGKTKPVAYSDPQAMLRRLEQLETLSTRLLSPDLNQ